MLEHTDGKNPIEPFVEFTIILHPDLYRKILTKFARRLELVLGNRDTRARDAVFLTEIVQGSAPTAADIQDLHAGLQFELAGDQIQLMFLCFVQRLRTLPVRAAIEHAFVQHGAIQILAQVVMLVSDLERSRPTLQIHEPRLQHE